MEYFKYLQCIYVSHSMKIFDWYKMGFDCNLTEYAKNEDHLIEIQKYIKDSNKLDPILADIYTKIRRKIS